MVERTLEQFYNECKTHALWDEQPQTSAILIYQNKNNPLKPYVMLQDKTSWLNQEWLVQFYSSSKVNVRGHIKIVFSPRCRARTFRIKESA